MTLDDLRRFLQQQIDDGLRKLETDLLNCPVASADIDALADAVAASRARADEWLERFLATLERHPSSIGTGLSEWRRLESAC